MNDETARALLDEMRSLNRSIASLTLEITEAASMISASHLVAVDATRSEVYATLMDDQLVDAARKLKLLMKAAREN